MRKFRKFILLFIVLLKAQLIKSRELELGPCYLSILEPCANNSIQFYLFDSNNPEDSPILLDNIAPQLPYELNETISWQYKMIIHGYGGHIDVNGSKQIRKGRK